MRGKAVSTSVVAEEVAHSVDCLLRAVELQSLEMVQRCGKSASAALVVAYYKQEEGHETFLDVGVSVWICVLQLLVSRALPRVLAFLQRLHAARDESPVERMVSTTLVYLVFCTLTLYRRLGSVLSHQQQQQQREEQGGGGGVAGVARPLGIHNNVRTLQAYTELRQEISAVLCSHFSLIAYNAEQQLWRLQAAATPPDAVNIPLMHRVPQMGPDEASMQDGCWIWLLLEASTSDMMLSSCSSVVPREAQEDESWVTRALLDMNPQDASDMPFARKLADILLAVYSFFLKFWMMHLPGLSEILDRWSRRDDMMFFLTSSQLLQSDEDMNINSVSRTRGNKRRGSEEEVWMLSEVCLVLRCLVRRAPVLFACAGPLLRLQRLLSQLIVIRLFFAVQRPLGSSDAADMLAVELSALEETAYEYVFVCCGLAATCTLLPYEASVPHVQLTLFDMAAHAMELHGNTWKALLAHVRPSSVSAGLRYAYMVSCVGVGAEEHIEGATAAVRNTTGALSQMYSLFTQSFVLGLEEVFSYLRACRFPIEDAPSLQHFFEAVQEAFRTTSVGCDVGKPLCPFLGESLAAVEQVLSVYLTMVRETLLVAPGKEVLPKHRCYWLLAVSYLRIADLEALMQHAAASSLTQQIGDNDIYWYCHPYESLQWIRLDDEGICCSNYKEWLKFRSRRKKRGVNMGSDSMRSCSLALRTRLISAAMRFYMLALYMAACVETSSEAGAKGLCESRSRAAATRGRVSQSTLYVTTFTRFLLMMGDMSTAEVVRCAEMSSRALSVWASTSGDKSSSNSCRCPIGTEDAHRDRITEADLMAAQSYQLALSLFII